MTDIESKEREIAHYIGVLDRYGSGRWADMGQRHLALLKEELTHLKEQNENDN